MLASTNLLFVFLAVSHHIFGTVAALLPNVEFRGHGQDSSCQGVLLTAEWMVAKSGCSNGKPDFDVLKVADEKVPVTKGVFDEGHYGMKGKEKQLELLHSSQQFLFKEGQSFDFLTEEELQPFETVQKAIKERCAGNKKEMLENAVAKGLGSTAGKLSVCGQKWEKSSMVMSKRATVFKAPACSIKTDKTKSKRFGVSAGGTGTFGLSTGGTGTFGFAAGSDGYGAPAAGSTLNRVPPPSVPGAGVYNGPASGAAPAGSGNKGPTGRPAAGRPAAAGKPAAERPAAGRPAAAGKPAAGRPAAGRPAAGRPAAGRPAAVRPAAAAGKPAAGPSGGLSGDDSGRPLHVDAPLRPPRVDAPLRPSPANAPSRPSSPADATLIPNESGGFFGGAGGGGAVVGAGHPGVGRPAPESGLASVLELSPGSASVRRPRS